MNCELIAEARERARDHIAGTVAVKQRVAAECLDSIVEAAAIIVTALNDGRKLLLCGNGGSAADCQHMAAELVSTLNHHFPRRGFPAIALTTDSSILTANANDFGYDGIFERQVQALGNPGDVVVGFTTSGNSKNVLAAVRYAAAHDLRTIGMTGVPGGELVNIAERTVQIPSSCVQFIQEGHIAVVHILCDLVEQSLCPELRSPAVL